MYEGVIQNLIDELGRLPGVGPKGAQRIAFYLLASDHADVKRLADALIEVTERVRFCRTCGNVAEADECRICLDPRRDPAVICVVEEPKDVAAVEKIREFRGRYHVLGGAISPIDGIGPDELRIKELMTRLADGTVTELILATDHAEVRRLADALIEVTERVRFCRTCGNVAEADECRICLDPRRDPAVICVVEEPKDVAAVEKIREFRGRYHVLGGAISPIDGVGPDELRIRELMARLTDGTVTELILATDPNLEGEATAAFLARLVKPMGWRVTRPASGLPVGGDLEYADEVTLGRAFEGRRLLDV